MVNVQYCPNCRYPIEPEDKFCRNCGLPFEERREEAPTPPPPLTPPTPPTPPISIPTDASGELQPPEEPKYVPWEDRQKLGFFSALWKTWSESVFNPEKFFSRLPFTGGLGSPILYALIILWATSIIDNFYNLIFANFWLGLIRDYVEKFSQFSDFGIGTGITFLSFFIKILLAPAFILLGLFIISGIYHLIAMIFGWNKRDFEATLRAVAYAVGPAIFAIVPMCGAIVGWIWVMVMTIIALKHTQKMSGGKAALVVLLPLILCCCIVAILGLIFSAAILAFIGKAAHGFNY